MNALILLIVHLIAFLGFGLLPATLLVKRSVIQSQYALIAGYAFSCLWGLGLFFVYAYNPCYGTVFTGIFYAIGLVCAIWLSYLLGKDVTLRKIFKINVFPPLILIVVVCGFYTATTLGCTQKYIPAKQPYSVLQACIFQNTPGDNVLAEFFGNELIHNNAGGLSGDWHLADRPPLQIGNVISLLDVSPNDSTKLFSYQIFSTFLQLSWIAGLWALLRSMKLTDSSRNFTLFISIFIGFYYYNSVYVWPKLLAAGFAISAISLLLYPNLKRIENIKNAYFDWVFIALLFALSLSAHGSIAFTIIPLAVYLLIKMKLPSLKVIMVVILVTLLIYGPWIIYQKTHTSSDRLVKWHLGGVVQVDNRTTIQTIKTSYSNLALHDWVDSKVKNVETMFYIATPKTTIQPTLLDKLRVQEFYATFIGFCVLNLGWFAAIYIRKKDQLLLKEIRPLLIVGLASLGVWILLMFLPRSTVIHQNSYATMMLLITFLATSISGLSERSRFSIAIFQIIVFLSAWVFAELRLNQHSLIIAIPLNFIAVMVIFLTVYYKDFLQFYNRILRSGS